MLSAARRAVSSRRVALPKTIAAPLLGWNTRDPFEAMEPTDAVLLDNWYPDFGGVSVRNGFRAYATSLVGTVETLATFESGRFSQFLAAAGQSIYDISSPGAAIEIKAGYTSSRWQTAVFEGHQFWANGADIVQDWNGTTMAAATFTGVPLATLSGVGAFHNRMFFWTGRDPVFWYGPVNGISGALTSFDLSTVQGIGGNLFSVQVLSYDGGTGIDSYTCFLMSSGEVLTYSGSDPSNASNWALVGRYILPPAINNRAIVRYGGDIYYTTANDHQQFSKVLIALKLGETPPRTKISGAVTAAHAVGGDLFGWDAIYYPVGRRLIFNIPKPDGGFDQHIYNTSVQGWTRFKGMDAACWGVFRDRLYFGSGLLGVVRQADIGNTDLVGLENTLIGIDANAQQAWNIFETPLGKRLTLARPVVEATMAGLDYDFNVGFDYRPPSIVTSVVIPIVGPQWGSNNWGDGTLWTAREDVVSTEWAITGGDGSAFSWGITTTSMVPTRWVRTDLMIEPGTML
jgi:hypothetical protein